jgi:hypothetical protein
MCTRPSTMNNAMRPRECGRAHAGNITIKRSQWEKCVCVTELCARHSVCAIFLQQSPPLKCWVAEQTLSLFLSVAHAQTEPFYTLHFLWFVIHCFFGALCYFEKYHARGAEEFCSGGSEVMQPVTHSDNFMPQKGTCHNTSSRHRHTHPPAQNAMYFLTVRSAARALTFIRSPNAARNLCRVCVMEWRAPLCILFLDSAAALPTGLHFKNNFHPELCNLLPA